jgi:hypothetical protein
VRAFTQPTSLKVFSGIKYSCIHTLGLAGQCPSWQHWFQQSSCNFTYLLVQGWVWGLLISLLSQKFSPFAGMAVQQPSGLKLVHPAGSLPCWPFCLRQWSTGTNQLLCSDPGKVCRPVLNPPCSCFVHRVACVGGSCQKQNKEKQFKKKVTGCTRSVWHVGSLQARVSLCFRVCYLSFSLMIIHPLSGTFL